MINLLLFIREEAKVDTCYYCGYPMENIHCITLYKEDKEHNELLCSECYAEWLESIKG